MLKLLVVARLALSMNRTGPFADRAHQLVRNLIEFDWLSIGPAPLEFRRIQ